MAPKSVFISSTFKDLKDYRRQVWDALKGFYVTVRGMEEFGARTGRALDTCLAEVEDSDVYVGIIAYRLGSNALSSWVQRASRGDCLDLSPFLRQTVKSQNSLRRIDSWGCLDENSPRN